MLADLLGCVNDTCVVAKLEHTQDCGKNGVDQETRQPLFKTRISY